MRYPVALLALLVALIALLTACGSSPAAQSSVPAPAPVKAPWVATAEEAAFMAGARRIAPALANVKDERLAGWGADNCSSLKGVDAATGKPFPRTKVVAQARERFLGKVTLTQAGKIADLSATTVCRR